MEKLKGGVNIIGYHGAIKDSFTQSISLVLEHVQYMDHRKAFKKYNDIQAQEYMYKLL